MNDFKEYLQILDEIYNKPPKDSNIKVITLCRNNKHKFFNIKKDNNTIGGVIIIINK